MEGCYLHNPATPPSRAEAGEAPARPRARLARGAAVPRNNVLSPPTPTRFFGVQGLERSCFQKNICIDRGVLYLLQSTVKKLETQGQREAEGTLWGEPDAVPRGLEKFRVGREGWESPLLAPGASGAAWPAATSRSPPPSRPFLFRRGPALGVAASRPRDPEREVRRRRRRRPRAPSGGHAPAARAAPGVPLAPPGLCGPRLLPSRRRGRSPSRLARAGRTPGAEGSHLLPGLRGAANIQRRPGPAAPRRIPPALPPPPPPPPPRPRSATARLLLRGPFRRRRARTRGRAPPGRRGPPRGPKEGRGRLKGWKKPPLLSTPFLLSIKDIWPLPPASPFFGVSSPGCEFRGDGKPFLQKLPIRPVKPAGQKVLFKKGTTRRKKRSTFPGQKNSLALEPSWSSEGGMRVARV
ncbi:basic proline-rich protein-like [Acinonyx jubatus]|uniref:Basic proline-rich protein-like n=1 Tax=Acinonyx jubatus TaxID=32536 RepID=A0ABM3P0C7_ACIJB|nr:basic proline-rich protein-like [Acinonyx jubatus]